MSFSMYDLSVPVFTNGLLNLVAILEKGKAYCSDNDVDEMVLIGDRLHSTMLPLASQVNMAIAQSTHSVARMIGDSELADPAVATCFDDLIAAVNKAITYLQGADKSSVANSADKEISYTVAVYQLNFPTAYIYLQNFALPNFYFHTTTAYNILRHNGVVLGKGDYLGDTGGSVVMLEE
jgi:hypothetical protein